ncbi:hypothetical protein KKC60_03435 [Patescibacteria group bacterium]|nr:hypothetical protein [Patescibacteria group bacterium]
MGTLFFGLIGLFLRFILEIEAGLLAAVSWAFNKLITTPSNVAAFDAVQVGWVVVRDVVNMFFILILLVMAFGTILRIENYQFKKLLPRLIIGILLVNFSRTICAIFIEFSDVLMRAFTFGNSNANIAAGFTRTLGMDKLVTVGAAVDTKTINDSSVAAGMAMLVIFVGLFILAMTGMVVLLTVRLVALMFLTVISPVAFLFDIVPKTQEYAKKWWGEFTKFILYGPVATFCVFLSLKVASTLSSKGTEALMPGGKLDTAALKGGFFITSWDFEQFMRFILIITMLYASFLVVKGVSSFGAGALLGFATGKVLGGAAGLTAGLFGIGKYGSATRAITRRSLMKGNEGLLGGAYKNTLGFLTSGVGALYGAARGSGSLGENWDKARKDSGNWVRFASPTISKDAWNARQQRIEEELRGRSLGWTRNKMNRVAAKAGFFNDKRDYELLENKRAVQQRMGEIKETNPNLEHHSLRREFYETMENDPKGSLDQKQALLEGLIQAKNLNEVFRDMGSNTDEAKDRRKMLFDTDFLNEVIEPQIAAGEGIDFNLENKFQLLKQTLGEQRAISVLREQGEFLKGKGGFDIAEATAYDKEMKGYTLAGEGEIRDLEAEGVVLTDAEKSHIRDRNRGHGAAVENNKQGARQRGQTSRFGVNKQAYINGDEKVVGLDYQQKMKMRLGLSSADQIVEEKRFLENMVRDQLKLESVQEANKEETVVSLMMNMDPKKHTGRNGAIEGMSNVCIGAELGTHDERITLFNEMKGKIGAIDESGFRDFMIKADPSYKSEKKWEKFIKEGDLTKRKSQAIEDLKYVFDVDGNGRNAKIASGKKGGGGSSKESTPTPVPTEEEKPRVILTNERGKPIS